MTDDPLALFTAPILVPLLLAVFAARAWWDDSPGMAVLLAIVTVLSLVHFYGTPLIA